MGKYLGILVAEDGNWMEMLVGGIKSSLTYIFAAVGVASVLFAIYLGFMLASAQDTARRAKAKKRIVSAVAVLMIMVILVPLIDQIELQTTSLVDYSLSTQSFVLTEVNPGPQTLTLSRNFEPVTGNVTFSVVGGDVSSISLSSSGRISATKEGSIVVNVLVDGVVKLENIYILVRPGLNTNPLDPGLPVGGGGSTGPAPTSPNHELIDPEMYNRLYNYAVKYVGNSGYTQKGSGSMPNRYASTFNPGSIGQYPNRTLTYFDCSSFVSWVFANVCNIFYANGTTQFQTTESIDNNTKHCIIYGVQNARPGDIMLYRESTGEKSAAIYLGNIERYEFNEMVNGKNETIIKSSNGIIMHTSSREGSAGNGFNYSNHGGKTAFRRGVIFQRIDSFLGFSSLTFRRPYNF